MVNKVQLIGYLADKPEINTTASGMKVAKLRVGTSERYKDKSGQYQSTTEWHNIVMFDKTAEIASQYLSKGSQVFIEGKIKYNTYEGKDGQKKYFTEIIVNEFKMLGKKDSNDSGSGNASNYSAATTPAAATGKNNNQPAYQAQSAGQNAQPALANNQAMATDDDLPF